MDQTFFVRTHHGDYLHEAYVKVAREISDSAAWEILQSHSPYTSNVIYDPNNLVHRDHVRDLAALRKGTANDDPEVYTPHPNWISGWSWTWIILDNRDLDLTTLTTDK